MTAMYSVLKLRTNIVKKANSIHDKFPVKNCRLFVNLMTNNIDFNKVPRGIEPKIGDVVQWGDGRHYAIYIGGGEVIEVPEWNVMPRVTSMRKVDQDYSDRKTIYRVPEKTYREITFS